MKPFMRFMLSMFIACCALPADGATGTDYSAAAPNAESICPLLVGSEVPEVTVKRTDGSDFDLAASVRSQPSVVIFYRGGW